MTLKEFMDDHKGVRRTILGFMILWGTASVGVGLWVMIARPLTGQDVSFLLGVITLMNVPTALYFVYRGKS